MVDLLTVKEAAALLGVSPQTLRRWDKSGKLRPMRHPISGYRLYARDQLEELSEAPTPDRTRLCRHRAPSNSFIGRKGWDQRVVTALSPGGLVTICGSPGVGKTRLAEEILGAHFADSHVFVDLRGANSVPAIISSLLHATQSESEPDLKLGTKIAGLVDDPRAALRWLASMGVRLVVLDGVEHLRAILANELGRWIDDSSPISVLATSREPLGLARERVLMLPPLQQSEAREMLMSRAEAAGLTQLDAVAGGVLERLSAAIDGNPLAIEVVAPALRTMTADELLTHPERLLDRVAPSAGASHSSAVTLREALDWSWGLLDADVRLALTCLGVFCGRPDNRAVNVVLEAAFPDREPPSAVIHTLCTKSLVTPTPGDPPRFRLPGPVSALVREQFLDLPSDAIDALEAGHCHHFVVEVGTQLPTDPFTMPQNFPSGVRDDVDDVAKALEHLARGEVTAPELLGGALRLVVALHPASGERIGLRDCVSLTQRLLGHPDAESTDAGDRAIAHEFLARGSLRLGHYEEAESAAQLAAELASGAADPLTHGLALVSLATLARRRDRQEDARRFCREAIDCFERAEHEAGWSLGQSALAVTHLVSGEAELAQEHLRLALESAERRGALAQVALYQGLLGNVAQDSGRLDDAEGWFRRALSVHRRLGDERDVGIFTGYLATVHHEREQWDAAHVYYDEAIATLAQVEHVRFEALFRACLGALHAETGELEAAAMSLGEAASLVDTHDVGSLEPVLDLHRAQLDLAWALQRTQPELQSFQARLITAEAGTDDLRFAKRRLERALERVGRRSSEADLVVASDGSWFEVTGADRVDLSRRAALKAVLGTLARARSNEPGRPVSRDELFAVGWPGQTAVGGSGAHRVRVAVWTLRREGLGELISTVPEGYLLRPLANIAVEA